MRNLFNKATGTAIAIAAAALLSSSSGYADEHVDPPAQVGIGVTCLVLLANPPQSGADVFEIMPPAMGGDAVTNAVVTPNGNVKLTCNGTLSTDALALVAPTRAVLFSSDDPDAGDCMSPGFGSMEEWYQVITPSGKVSLTCHSNGQL